MLIYCITCETNAIKRIVYQVPPELLEDLASAYAQFDPREESHTDGAIIFYCTNCDFETADPDYEDSLESTE